MYKTRSEPGDGGLTGGRMPAGRAVVPTRARVGQSTGGGTRGSPAAHPAVSRPSAGHPPWPPYGTPRGTVRGRCHLSPLSRGGKELCLPTGLGERWGGRRCRRTKGSTVSSPASRPLLPCAVHPPVQVVARTPLPPLGGCVVVAPVVDAAGAAPPPRLPPPPHPPAALPPTASPSPRPSIQYCTRPHLTPPQRNRLPNGSPPPHPGTLPLFPHAPARCAPRCRRRHNPPPSNPSARRRRVARRLRSRRRTAER